MPASTIHYAAWLGGSRDRAVEVAYVWLIAQRRHRRYLRQLVGRLPIEGEPGEDRVQEAFFRVSRSSLGRRDGSIADARGLEAYLMVGTRRRILHQYIASRRQLEKRSCLEQIVSGASSPDPLFEIAQVRALIADDLFEGRGMRRPAREQGRYEAAEGMLEAEAALELCVSSRMHERIIAFMERTIARFSLSPDSEEATVLLNAREHCTHYLMWRLGLKPSSRGVLYTRRSQLEPQLKAHPEFHRLSGLLRRIGRSPGLIPCTASRVVAHEGAHEWSG